MIFNLSSTQFYLFFSSFGLKNYKLCDQLPPPDFYASLDKERHFRSSKITLQIKSLHNILSDQIFWMMEQQKQELQGQIQGIDNHAGVFFQERVCESLVI